MGGMDLESRIAALEAENAKLREAIANSVLLAFTTAMVADKARSGDAKGSQESLKNAVLLSKLILKNVEHEDLFGSLDDDLLENLDD